MLKVTYQGAAPGRSVISTIALLKFLMLPFPTVSVVQMEQSVFQISPIGR